MAFANVYIEHLFEPSVHIHARCCQIIGDPYGGASELEGIPDSYKIDVKAIADEYLYRCRELTTICKGEAEWRSLLLEGPIRCLVELLGADMLTTTTSDKPWLAALKPRQPSIRELFALLANPRLMPLGGTLLPQSYDSIPSSFGTSLSPGPTTTTPTNLNYDNHARNKN
jgi:hypothetical protein